MDTDGLAVASAVAPRVLAHARWRSRGKQEGVISITGLFAKLEANYLFRVDSAGSISCIAGNVDDMIPRLIDYWFRSIPSAGAFDGEIVIDSRKFFNEKGDKLGFGSSAATTIALIALLEWRAISDTAERESKFLHMIKTGYFDAWCVKAHRFAQQGGSGYDIVASIRGGVGCIRQQGQEAGPIWIRSLGFPLPRLWIWRGEQSVVTSHAVKKYRSWRRAHPDLWRAFFREHNSAVKQIIESVSWKAATSSAKRAIDLAIELGDAIEASARMGHPRASENFLFKAVGAGNELGLLFDHKNLLKSANAIRADSESCAPLLPLNVEREGIRVERYRESVR